MINYQISKQNIIKFKTVNTENNYNFLETLFFSKIGGLPYWPLEQLKDYPIIENEKAKLLCQLNLTDLKNKNFIFPDFYPEKGILQFFIENNGNSFFHFDNLLKSNIKVIYHENINYDLQINIDNIDYLQIFKTANNNDRMPFNGEELILEPFQESEILGPKDIYNFNLIYNKNPYDLSEEEWDELMNLSKNYGTKIGGYAYFVQEDPRKIELESEWQLLLQIDSDENICIADSGVMNFFIKKRDLINKNFNDIYFTFDCA